MLDNRRKLTDYVLDVAYITLTKLNDYGRHLTLVGAYSIFRQLKAQYVGFDENNRATNDLDFDLYNLSLDETDYVFFQRALRSALGSEFSVEFYPMKVRPKSITYSFNVGYRGVSTKRLKIDFALMNGQKSFDSQPLYISLATKLCLSAQIIDRRFKDKLDVITILRYLYRDGISKQELLTIIKRTGNTLEVDERWFSSEWFDLVKASQNNFEGVSESLLMTSTFQVRNLITGLKSNKVPMQAKFYGGKWLW